MDKLYNALRVYSQADDFQSEWRSHRGEDGIVVERAENKCFCGHPIKYKFLIYNPNTLYIVPLGSSCIKKFSTSIYAEYKALKKSNWRRCPVCKDPYDTTHIKCIKELHPEMSCIKDEHMIDAFYDINDYIIKNNLILCESCGCYHSHDYEPCDYEIKLSNIADKLDIYYLSVDEFNYATASEYEREASIMLTQSRYDSKAIQSTKFRVGQTLYKIEMRRRNIIRQIRETERERAREEQSKIELAKMEEIRRIQEEASAAATEKQLIINAERIERERIILIKKQKERDEITREKNLKIESIKKTMLEHGINSVGRIACYTCGIPHDLSEWRKCFTHNKHHKSLQPARVLYINKQLRAKDIICGVCGKSIPQGLKDLCLKYHSYDYILSQREPDGVVTDKLIIGINRHCFVKFKTSIPFEIIEAILKFTTNEKNNGEQSSE